MLALTPAPLQTAGERALFDELTRWDTGGAVRGAVMASLPVVDGPMERRLSDAVLFVPEGLAVVRVVEVVRQSGVVTALPEGAWTIGPGAGPGDVLRLAGGGSTPLDGLMRAGMDAALRLRRAGLEPGPIARLTVLVGDLTGLVPADGDLGEGDQVALAEPRSLLLGIARVARHTGADNPRLWTTADVRAALEALGLAGRSPSVQSLNGEGFPYSPYVLRTPELLAPATMTAAPRSPLPWAVVPAPLEVPVAVPAAAGPPAPPAAVRPVAPAAGAPPAAAGLPDTLVGPPPGLDGEETGGIGGLFADPEPVDPAEDREPPRAAAAVPAPPAPAPPAAAPAPPAPAPPLAGASRPAGTPAPAAPAGAPSAGTSAAAEASPPADPAAASLPTRPPLPEGHPLGGPRRRPAARRRTAVRAAAAVLGAVVLGIAGAAVLGGDDPVPAPAAAPSSSVPVPAPAEDAGPVPGDREVVDGRTFEAQRLQVDPTCVGNAYGAVADFFTRTDCAGLSRALWSTDVGGRPVVVSVSLVDMPDVAAARALQALADRNGSGNVSDLLREGVRYPGGPQRLSGAEYASAVSGTTVTIVEAAWAQAGSAGSTADLDLVAGSSLVLPVLEPAAG